MLDVKEKPVGEVRQTEPPAKEPAAGVATLPEGISEDELAGLSQEERTELLKDLDLGGSPEPDDPAKIAADASEKADDDKASLPKFKIKVSGKEREVEQSELIELAQKGDDYTQKSQRVAKMLAEMQSDPLGFIQRSPEISRRFYEQYEAAIAPKPEDIAIPDRDDPASVTRFKASIQSMVNAGVQSALSARSGQDDMRHRIQSDVGAINESRSSEGVEKLSIDEIKAIAAYGDENGITSFRAAYRDMNYDADTKQAGKLAAQKIVDKINATRNKESHRLPSGGGGHGKGGGKPVTEADLANMDLTALPDAEVDALLKQFG